MATTYPERSSMGISRAFDGTVWQYIPPNMVEVTPAAGNTPALGPVSSHNTGDVLAAGWWVLVDRAIGTDPASLLQSTGTTTMPFDGDAYALTWS